MDCRGQGRKEKKLAVSISLVRVRDAAGNLFFRVVATEVEVDKFKTYSEAASVDWIGRGTQGNKDSKKTPKICLWLCGGNAVYLVK